MSPPEIEPETLDSPAGHLVRLDTGTVNYLRLKLFQNPFMNGTWQYIYIWLRFCVFMQSLSVNSYE